MLDKNGNRMLSYVAEVTKISPIEGADNIALATINEGWEVIIKKSEFKVGDLCAFFEIDSLLPSSNPAFAFLANRDFKVKTYKLSRFGVVSAGLAMPLDLLNLKGVKKDDDLTKKLGVTYAIKEDNERKNPSQKKKKSILMKLALYRWLYFKIKELKKGDMAFPSKYAKKTDEERIQNMPYILKDKTPFVVTEKVDGTSTTILLVRKKMKFYVCSRNNVVVGGTIYNDNANKYKMKEHLVSFLKEHKDISWACVQGESYGKGWQGNPLNLEGTDFVAFNFIDSKNGRWGSLEGKALLEKWGIPWVPIIDKSFILPDTVDELLSLANGKSMINKEVLREGLVLRSLDGKKSFKAVSPEYLMKHKI